MLQSQHLIDSTSALLTALCQHCLVMRRADRLSRVIQILRRSRRPATAEAVTTELSISNRSVLRDMADVTSQGVPIHGEAGVGYTLDRRYELPQFCAGYAAS